MKTFYNILSRNFVILICSFVLLFFLLQIIFIKDHTFYNPDEFEWLYCSQRLMENDFKLSSFDSHTTGPFSIYILSFYFKITNNFSIENLHIFKELIKLLTVSLFVVYNLKDKWKLIISVLLTLMLLSIPNPDILSYNTEFLSLPILAYLYYNRNKPVLFVESLLIFVLPLIKLQFAVFTVLFGLNQLYRLYFHNDIFIKYTKLFFLYVSFALFFYFTVFINYFEVFIFNYFEKNMWHMCK